MAIRTDIRYDVRPYQERDQEQVLELLTASLGEGPTGVRSAEFFGWKHVDNPAGRSFMLVAEVDGRIIGLRAFMRWRFRAGERVFRAVQAVDTATHPEFQGLGVFSRLTKDALAALHDDIDLVYNTPNEKSLPGYLKMGWQIVGDLPVSVRIRRPLRFATRVRSLRRESAAVRVPPPVSAPAASDVLAHGSDVAALLAGTRAMERRLTTDRDLAYLRWRYGTGAPFNYRALTAERDGQLAGLAVFRLRHRGRLREAAVTELINLPDDPSLGRHLLRQVVRSSAVDHVICSFPRASASARAAAWGGFVPTPIQTTVVVNTLGRDFDPDPTDLSSWALTLGDLEVF